MDFDQTLRLVAIGVGVVMIILAIVTVTWADESGCLAFILIIIGGAMMVYGFTGDSNVLKSHVWGAPPF